jgi:hypothetical protein
MSVPVRLYVPRFESFAVEPDVPAATGIALPAVPVAPAVALAAVPLPAGSVGVADTGGGTGDGVSESAPGFGASGSTTAFASVNGRASEPPATQPVIVTVFAGAAASCGELVCADVHPAVMRTRPVAIAILIGLSF